MLEMMQVGKEEGEGDEKSNQAKQKQEERDFGWFIPHTKLKH